MIYKVLKRCRTAPVALLLAGTLSLPLTGCGSTSKAGSHAATIAAVELSVRPDMDSLAEAIVEHSPDGMAIAGANLVSKLDEIFKEG